MTARNRTRDAAHPNRDTIVPSAPAIASTPGAPAFLQRCIDHAPDAVLITDARGIIRYVNAAFERAAGRPAHSLVGRSPRVLDVLRRDRAAFRLLAETVLAGATHRGRISQVRDRRPVIHEHTISPVQDDAGRITHFIATVRTVAASAPADRMDHDYDPVTRLPMWPVLAERARPVLARARREDSPAALGVLHVDGMSAINETYGREVGDQLLRIMADRLQATLRASDVAARLDGAAFAALLQDVVDNEVLGHAADRILRALSQTITLEDRRSLDVGAVMGMALYPRDGSTLRELRGNAERALDRARQAGTAFEFHRGELSVQARQHLELASDLRQAS
ncbi:MAG TPA: diguanylate cyclase, partial [Longimicrobiales bacterium]|nr:diguanylate cyclase [Longimicrobiales bacterium]